MHPSSRMVIETTDAGNTVSLSAEHFAVDAGWQQDAFLVLSPEATLQLLGTIAKIAAEIIVAAGEGG